jgi:hypothetical protein
VIIVAVLVLLPCAAQGAATLENSASSSNNGSGTSYTLNFGWTATANRLLVLAASWDKDVTNLCTTCSDSWTRIDYVIESTNSTTCAMWYKVADGTETSAALTWTNSEDISVWVGEYSGMDSVSPFDVKSSNDTGGETTSVSTGTTLSTAQNTELAIAMMGADTANNVDGGRSWNNDFTEFTWLAGDGSMDPGLSVARKDLTSQGTVTTTFTTTDSGDNMCAIVGTFKEADPDLEQIHYRWRNDDGGETNRRTIILTSVTSWQVPSDWNNSDHTVHVIGGGGGGGKGRPGDHGPDAGGGAGGGGGGAYASATNSLSLTPSSTINIQIGSGGTGGSSTEQAGTAGGDTWFDSSSTLMAKGGSGGLSGDNQRAGVAGGAGGAAASSVGDTTQSGGTGGTGGTATGWSGGGGGGGAGAAGDTAAGTNGSTGADGVSDNSGGAGGDGGQGNPTGGGAGGSGGATNGGTGYAGTAGTELVNGNTGSGGGGGGGAGASSGDGANAGAGANYGAGGGGERCRWSARRHHHRIHAQWFLRCILGGQPGHGDHRS